MAVLAEIWNVSLPHEDSLPCLAAVWQVPIRVYTQYENG